MNQNLKADKFKHFFGEGSGRLWLLALVISLVSVALYLPALGNTFVNWDDHEYIYQNPFLKSLDAPFVKWAFTTFRLCNWHPLTWISFGADYSLWDLNPTGYHLTNIVLHGLNVFLVMILMGGLFTKALGPLRSGGFFALALVGITFGLHPLHVESVAWVSERKDVLYAFFWLLSLLSYVAYTSGVSFKRRALYYLLSLVLFTLSLLSKPMAVTLPLVFLILDFSPLGRLGAHRGFIRIAFVEKLPFFALSLASSIVTVAAQKTGGAMALMNQLSLGERLLVAEKALGFYLVKTFSPLHLVPYYPLERTLSLVTWQYLGSLFLVVGISAVGLKFWRQKPVLIAAWTYYIVTLVPVLGIIQVGGQAAADRYMYLPVLGPLVLVGVLALWAWNKREKIRPLLVLATVLVTIVFSVLTVRQVRVWKDSLSLWQYVALHTPDHHLGYFNIGRIYFESKQYEKAVMYLDKALSLNVYIGDIYYFRGKSLDMIGQHERAVEDLTKAIRIGSERRGVNVPGADDIYKSRGDAYFALNQYKSALEDYTSAVTLRPDAADIYFGRGNIHLKAGLVEKAVDDYKTAISLKSDYCEAFANLGNAYAAIRRYDKAVDVLSRAIDLRPTEGCLYLNRGNAYADRGDTRNALLDYQSAARNACKPAQDFLTSRGIPW